MTETEKMDEEKRKKELEAKRKISFPLLFGGGGGGRTHLSRSSAREWREFLERIARSCILRDGDGERRGGCRLYARGGERGRREREALITESTGRRLSLKSGVVREQNNVSVIENA